MKPQISIIVPCYNQARFLDECLNSVLNQSLDEWECIIVNDGSTDNTIEIATAWLEKDHRFQLINKKNDGPSSSRNAGIKLANSKFILPLDADDFISKEYTTLALREFERYPSLVLVYCECIFFGIKTGRYLLEPFNFKRMLVGNHIFVSSIYRKSDWLEIGGYDERMRYGHEDWEFYVNLLSRKEPLVQRLTHDGFFYRQKELSISTFCENKKIVRWNKSIVRLKSWRHYSLIKVLKAFIYTRNLPTKYL